MTEIHRVIPIKADADLRRALEYIYTLLERRNGGSVVPQAELDRIIEQAKAAGRLEATQLIGAFGQPLAGDVSSADPLVTPIGQSGTLSNLTANNSVSGLTMTISTPTTTPVINLSGVPNIAGTNITSGTIDTARLPATINVATAYQISNTQVVNSRKTGWGAASGTLSRAAYASKIGQIISDPPTQVEVQNLDDAVTLLSKTVAALITDLTAHGLIGT